MPEVPVWRLAIEISGEAPSDMAIIATLFFRPRLQHKVFLRRRLQHKTT